MSTITTSTSGPLCVAGCALLVGFGVGLMQCFRFQDKTLDLEVLSVWRPGSLQRTPTAHSSDFFSQEFVGSCATLRADPWSRQSSLGGSFSCRLNGASGWCRYVLRISLRCCSSDVVEL